MESEQIQPTSTAGDTAVPFQNRRGAREVASRAIVAVKAQHAADRSTLERAAEMLNRIAASPAFLLAHVIWFVIWIGWNIGAFGFRPFDPFPFGLLTMVVSLEAIFLAIFVLLAQKREAAIAELREELSLQVQLWTEREVTKTLQLVTGLYRRLGHALADDAELREMLGPLDVRQIESRLIEQIDPKRGKAAASAAAATSAANAATAATAAANAATLAADAATSAATAAATSAAPQPSDAPEPPSPPQPAR